MSVVWERGELDEFFRYVCTTVVVTPAGKVRVTENLALCTSDGSTMWFNEGQSLTLLLLQFGAMT